MRHSHNHAHETSKGKITSYTPSGFRFERINRSKFNPGSKGDSGSKHGYTGGKTRPRKRRVATSSNNVNDDSDSDCQIISKPDQFRFNASSSRAGPSRTNFGDCVEEDDFMLRSTPNVGPEVNIIEDSDSDSGIISISEDEFTKVRTLSSRTGPSTNHYGDYEDEDEEMDEDNHTFHPMPNVGPSTVGRRSRGDSEDRPAEGAYAGSDAANHAHLSGKKIGEPVNDNIIPGLEESSGISSRTRSKMRSLEKTAESCTVPRDSGMKLIEFPEVIELSSEDEMCETEDKLSEKNKETNNEGADDAPKVKHVTKNAPKVKHVTKNAPKVKHVTKNAPKVKRVTNNSSTAPCLDQSQLAKNSCEAEEMNMLQSQNQSRSDLWILTKVPPLAEEPALVAAEDIEPATVAVEGIDCDKGVGKEIVEIGKMPEADNNTDKRVKKKLSSLPRRELVQGLGNSVLERGPLIVTESDDESTQAPKSELPIKFRFAEDTPKKAKKTEDEMMLEADWAEWPKAAPSFGQSSSKLPEVSTERECSPVDDSQEARCARKDHETTQDEEIGVYCIHCGSVVLEPKHILPHWADKPRRKPSRKRLAYTNEFPEFADKRVKPSSHVERPSAKKAAAFTCPNDGPVMDIIPFWKELYPHQQKGFEFLWKNLAGSTDIAEVKKMAKPDEVGGCIISHAPGTGKTRLTIVFLETYLKVFPNSRPVIMAPAGMLLTWIEQFKKWGFSFRVHNLNSPELTADESQSAVKSVFGPKSDITDMVRMVKLYSWDKGGGVLLISYSLFEALTGKKESNARILGEILVEKPGLVILDEGHTARNELSNIWNALSKLKTDKRVILSGTPFQNNFNELYNTLKLVRPAVTKDNTLFRMNTSKKKTGCISETIDGAELEKLKNIMLPFVNVYKGTKVNGLGEYIILLKPPSVHEKFIKNIEGQNVLDLDHKVALASMHPYLLLHCKQPEMKILDMATRSVLERSRLDPSEGAKTKFIFEFLRLSVAANEKVLIFSQFIAPLELIKDQLKVVFQWVEGKQILHMESKLDVIDRQIMIDKLNDSSEARVMLAPIKCCSEGISLVGASRVVLLDVGWNPSVARQAISRACRIGQTKFVHAYHLMTSGTTEREKYCRQVDKERISELVFCSPNEEKKTDEGEKQESVYMEKDTIIEQMTTSLTLAGMFDKIILKDSNIFQNFGFTDENASENA